MDKSWEILIDSRNITLWEELRNQYQIQIYPSPEKNYLSTTNNNTSKIYVDLSNLNPAYFTHELQHIYVKKRNIHIIEDLYNQVKTNNILFMLLSKPLKDHIGNCLEHQLMLPIFLKLGFSNEEFLNDFNEKKINKEELTSIINHYKSGNKYNTKAVDFYIGKYFSIKSCNNKKFNYDFFLKEMKKVDFKMFSLLENFWDDWLTFNIEDINDSYDEILSFFIEDLIDWSINKKFT